MSSMFLYCESLKSIPDITKWDISSVKDMTEMFKHCHELIDIPDISIWNIKDGISTAWMFDACKKISKDIPLKFK